MRNEDYNYLKAETGIHDSMYYRLDTAGYPLKRSRLQCNSIENETKPR